MPGKRKAVNELDRFAIDYGLCMYCGICVEVCPFDALHWSPFFEYTSYTYEGMVHERRRPHRVAAPRAAAAAPSSPTPTRRRSADAQVAHDKRVEGVAGVIREADKKEAYLAKEAGVAGPCRRHVADAAPATAASGAGCTRSRQPGPSAAPRSRGRRSRRRSPTRRRAAPPPQRTLGGLPRIDPNNLPAGIGPVERGRSRSSPSSRSADTRRRPTSSRTSSTSWTRWTARIDVLIRTIAFFVFAGLTAVASLFAVMTRNVVHAALGLAGALDRRRRALHPLRRGVRRARAGPDLRRRRRDPVPLRDHAHLDARASRSSTTTRRGWPALVALGVVRRARGRDRLARSARTKLDFDVAFPTKELGNAIFTTWILPFEAVSFLLLAALVGAIVLARRD